MLSEPHQLHSAGAKACPFCAEEVRPQARKCRYCGETIDVTLWLAEEAKKVAELAYSRTSGAAVQGGPIFYPGGTHVARQRGFPHLLHLTLTLLTCGFWLPVWIVHRIVDAVWLRH